MSTDNGPTLSQEIANRLVHHDSRDEFERGLLEKAKKAGQEIVSAADEVLSWNTNALPWEVIGRVSDGFNKAMVSLNEICESIRNGEQVEDSEDAVKPILDHSSWPNGLGDKIMTGAEYAAKYEEGSHTAQRETELTEYLISVIRNDSTAFNKEFLPLLELLTSSTAPLMSLLEAKNSHDIQPDNNMPEVRMAGMVLVMLHRQIGMLIEDAACLAVENQN